MSTQYMTKIKNQIKGMTVKIEIVTPRMAESFLKTNDKNRKLSKKIVRKWTNSLQAEEWSLNGESIKFDKRGHLIDGQHRLTAIAESDVPAPLVIVRGLETEAFHTIDIGKSRTSPDVLSSNGVEGASWIAGGLVWVNKLTTQANLSTAGTEKLSPNNIMDYYLSHKRIEKYGPLARKLSRTKMANATSLMALFYLMDKKDARLGLKLRSGLEESFRKGELFDKMHQKIRRLASVQKASSYWEIRRRVGIIIKCWNAYRENKTSGFNDIDYRWENEDWPKIK